jgi:uncharacterized protein
MPLTDDQIREILSTSSRIAVVGMSPNPARPSHGVSRYLREAGYQIIPVRPGVSHVLEEPAFPDLISAVRSGPIDIVDVFRRSDAVPSLVQPCIAIRPRLVWLQEGVIHEGAAAELEAAGIPVVMDRCLMVEHGRLFGEV